MPGWWKVPYSCQFMQRGRHQQACGFYRAVCVFLSFFIDSETGISSGLNNIVYCMNLHSRMSWIGEHSNQLNSYTLSPKLRFHKNGRTGEYLMRWYSVKKYQKMSILNTNVSCSWHCFSGRKTVARWICLGSDDSPWQAFRLFSFILLL